MDDRQFHRIAKALSDPSRFEILQRISSSNGEEVPCANLTDICSVTKATLSHHLKELADAGLIDTRRESRFMYLTPRRDVLSAYLEELKHRLTNP
ncbi:helix-turn-helix domain-containing protein [uncultured Paludibaculum sp.]|uniref:ArsR/SmtB family transcription factor n=1 Tax=uncultured Paludibaculum sp. TaxID=1765020 RepID=UPI002AABF7E8|nr:helix-turn-helix domain-containing protein [uncultured Paludibaculum sp.]